MKKILGLDLGTNAIGWALINQDIENNNGNVIASGSRILPLGQDLIGKFDSGISISQTAERTNLRGTRRLRERHLLRRERLHRVLNILGFLPNHYGQQIDFEKHLGQFIPETEPKLPYIRNSGRNKSDFIFKNSYEEMLQDFQKHQPQLISNHKKVSHDWTIYFLRKKALEEKIDKEELAWLLLNFCQKRGYYQLRGEDEEHNPKKLIEFHSLKVTNVVATDDKKDNNEIWYNVHLENGWIYRRTNKIFLDWTGKIKEFIVTTDLNDDGTIKTDKEGKEKRSFRVPAENDWTLLKKKTEYDIIKSNETVGTYIYNSLLQSPNQKIKGKLVKVIERKFYKAELEQILKTQQKFHKELQNEKIYKECIKELYENNDAHRNNIGEKDFTYLFLNDIIFYQRPLKSKKSLISNCKFETRSFIKEGKREIESLKCIAKSHPLFQEFRLWQWLQNLKIIENETDKNVTEQFLQSEEDWINLFKWLNEKKEVDHKALLKYLLKPLKLKPSNYRWNYDYDPTLDESKSYPCNETRTQIQTRLAKIENLEANFLTNEKEEQLWHILYSVEDKIDIEKALKTFALKNELGEDFIYNFKKFPPFKKEYGSYSAKAIKKLLPLMRRGEYWNESNIHPQTKDRIDKILTGEFDESIRDRAREESLDLYQISDFNNLPPWLAAYIVYDSEKGERVKWKTPDKIEKLAQHSLRNPIIEQVINETLQVVKSIWLQYGNGAENFFDEIHIELSREMKNPSDKRKSMTNQIRDNENTNLRIKALLIELMNDGNIENVRPFSPMQQEILKIYEEGVLSAEEGNVPEDILKISKKAQPPSSELLKYRLWLQQKYRSPYTGAIVPLNKLFTREYNIEHIIPQSRYFDDSLSNKVICEMEVNKDKNNLLAYEYIKSNYGKTIELSRGEQVQLFTSEEYEKFVKKTYSKSRRKGKNLLMEDLPEDSNQRQLNDNLYISKVVKNLMSNIVRDDGEQDAISKNVMICTGAITSKLKQDWCLNDVWNEIITPRFERLNEITNSHDFGEWTNKNGEKFFQTQVPLELQKGFNKKRIDHRYHALEAIVIACMSKNHLNYLSNVSVLSKNSKEEKDKQRSELKNKLCIKKYNDDAQQNYNWIFIKPWNTFTQDAKESLKSIVVSFKQNLRVINKTINHYQVRKKNEQGELIKEQIKQIRGDNWAVRKPMHKETISGLVRLKLKKEVSLSIALDHWEMITDKVLRKQIKELIRQKYDKKKIQVFFKDKGYKWNDMDVSRPEIYYWDKENVASRVKIDESFGSIKIQSITDTGIQKIMLNHLIKYNEIRRDKLIEHAEQAFSIDGLDEMNKNMLSLNDGKGHHPIYKIRTYEPMGNKFNVGQSGNKKAKYVEAAKGTNLFFAIYDGDNNKRNYSTIPLNIVIERQKQGEEPVPKKNAVNQKLLMHLSPNDLVYVPSEEERDLHHRVNFEKLNEDQINRIYKIVSFTGNRLYAIPISVANSIVDKVEFNQLNKLESSLDKFSIKEFCIKIKIDRLGQIKLALNN